MHTEFRTLPLRNLLNIRDLGGYPTEDGRITRYRRFVRCELPKSLDSDEVEFLKSYGVTVSLDFRGNLEVSQKPSFLSSGNGWQKYVQSSIFDEHAAAGAVSRDREQRKAPPSSADVFDTDWTPVYIGMTENAPGWVRRNFELAASEPGCILFHCATGKDRTGVFSALLLSCAGVRRADIISDYSISMIHMAPVYELMAKDPVYGFPGGVVDWSKRFFQTRPETMARFLDYFEDKYGSIRGFVLSCGVTPEALDAVVSSFTEDVR